MNKIAQRAVLPLLALATLATAPAHAQCLPVPLGQIDRADPDPFDTFGTSMDMDGNVAVIGCPGDDDKGTDAGAAYVFRWNGVSWVEQAKLTATDGAASDAFGASVAISGSRIAVGAPNQDALGASSNTGAVYVFEYFPTQGWLQAIKLWPVNSTNYFAGRSVSMDGDLVALGAPSVGKAWVYRVVGGIWNLEFAGSSPGYEYGAGVAIHGDTLAIGEPYFDLQSGRVSCFQRSSGTWTYVQTLSGLSHFEYFGTSVALDDSRLIVGRESGAADAYESVSGTWSKKSSLMGLDARRVDVSGNRALVSNGGGSTYLYQDSNSGWVLVSKNPNSGSTSGDLFGSSVAITTDKYMVGARGSDVDGTDAGLAFGFSFFNAETYCTAKPTTLPGCLVHMDSVGTPTAADPTAFIIKAGPAPGKRVGIFFFSTNGPAAVPFQMGTLCVQSPVTRSASMSSGGTAETCDGQYQMTLASIAAKDPGFGAGLNYYVQAWFRDPGNFFDSSLSDGLWFVVCN